MYGDVVHGSLTRWHQRHHLQHCKGSRRRAPTLKSSPSSLAMMSSPTTCPPLWDRCSRSS